MKEETLNWIDIGKLEDIPVQGARRVFIAQTTIAVFRTSSNDVFAIEDKCPHAGGPLSEGIVHGNCVTCPLHNWVISLEEGKALGADEGQVKRYPVRTKDQRLMLASDAIAAESLTNEDHDARAETST